MADERAWRGCVFVGVSLDGFIAKPDGDLAWLTEPEPRVHAAQATQHPALVWETFFPTVDSVVMGRATYEAVLDMGWWPYEGRTVLVLSTTLDRAEGVIVARSVDEACGLLNTRAATCVYVDGGRTVQSFLAAGLVDEITVSIAPILLGRGRRLFGDLDRDVLLTLRGHHATPDDGLVRATYDVEPRRRGVE